MNKLRLDRYAVGDIVEMRRTGKVVKSAGTVDGHYLEMADTKTGYRFGIMEGNGNAYRVEMVLRAPRPKPKQGDIITGAQVRDTQWKRGTIFRVVEFETGPAEREFSGLVLCADGLLHSLDNQDERPSTYQFSNLNPRAKFELRFVA